MTDTYWGKRLSTTFIGDRAEFGCDIDVLQILERLDLLLRELLYSPLNGSLQARYGNFRSQVG